MEWNWSCSSHDCCWLACIFVNFVGIIIVITFRYRKRRRYNSRTDILLVFIIICGLGKLGFGVWGRRIIGGIGGGNFCIMIVDLRLGVFTTILANLTWLTLKSHIFCLLFLTDLRAIWPYILHYFAILCILSQLLMRL